MPAPLPAATRAASAFALALGAGPAGAGAQAPGAPAPGALPDSGAVIRLHAPSLDLSGRAVTLVARWGDPLLLVDPRGEGATAVPLRAVERVDVRVREGRGGAAHGARVGAIVGAVPSLLLVAAAIKADGDCRGECFLPATPFALVAGVLVTGVTTGVGALVGHASGGPDWQPVWVPPRSSSLRLAPVGLGGRGVGLALGGTF